MRCWILTFFLAVAFGACSDHGTEVSEGWIQYSLSHGCISLPSELTQTRVGAAGPENPEFQGVVQTQFVRVQFYVNSPLLQSAFVTYEEETVTLHGRKVVLFRGMGLFHAYDSSFGRLIGARAYFDSSADPVVVAASIPNSETESLALAILMTLRP
jgi:hypothetical protein